MQNGRCKLADRGPPRSNHLEWLWFDDAVGEFVIIFAIDAELNPKWPDTVDWVVALFYLAVLIAVPLVGYTSIGLHIRDYLRSLRRALVVIGQYRLDLPDWIR